MPTTPNGQFPYMDASDPLGNVAQRVQELAERLDDVYEPWTLWEPSLVGPLSSWEIVLGDGGSLVCAYTRWLDTVHFQVSLEFGTGGDLTGDAQRIYLPGHLTPKQMSLVPAGTQMSVGTAHALDWGTNEIRMGEVRWAGTIAGGVDGIGGAIIPHFAVPASDASHWGSDVPFDWAENDTLHMWGSYRVVLP